MLEGELKNREMRMLMFPFPSWSGDGCLGLGQVLDT